MHPIIKILFAAILITSAHAVERPLEPIAAALEPTRTVVYKTVGERELTLHIFEPAGFRKSDRRPVYLTIHGGGWTGRTPRYFYPFAKHFADLGMVGISLEYRLLDEAQGTTVFDCVKDGRSAVRFIRKHAAELGIDPNRIAVSGGSAGGHIAAGTALFDGIDEAGEDTSVSCVPDVLILYYPVIDTSSRGYGQSKIGERWRELSPVEQVRPGLPPTLLLHGTADKTTPFFGATLFNRRMVDAGNEIEFIQFRCGRHGYFLFDLDLFAEAMAQTEDFLIHEGILPVDIWEYEWTDDTTFGDADPAWDRHVSGIDQSIDDTSPDHPAIFTTGNPIGFAYMAQSSHFPASSGDGKTVEFRAKVNSQLGDAGAGALLAWGSVANNRHTVVLTETGVKFNASGNEYAMDTSVFNDFRLTFDDAKRDGGAALYVNGNATPVLTQTLGSSTGGTNLMMIGDSTGGDGIAGVTEWEFVRWTNAGRFAPDSNPASATGAP